MEFHHLRAGDGFRLDNIDDIHLYIKTLDGRAKYLNGDTPNAKWIYVDIPTTAKVWLEYPSFPMLAE